MFSLFSAIFVYPNFALIFVGYILVACGVICYLVSYKWLSRRGIKKKTRFVLVVGLLISCFVSICYMFLIASSDLVSGYVLLMAVSLTVWIPISIYSSVLLLKLESTSSLVGVGKRESMSAVELRSTRLRLIFSYGVLLILLLIAYIDWMSGISMLVVATCLFICVPLAFRRFLLLRSSGKGYGIEYYLCGIYPVITFLLFATTIF